MASPVLHLSADSWLSLGSAWPVDITVRAACKHPWTQTGVWNFSRAGMTKRPNSMASLSCKAVLHSTGTHWAHPGLLVPAWASHQGAGVGYGVLIGTAKLAMAHHVSDRVRSQTKLAALQHIGRRAVQRMHALQALILLTRLLASRITVQGSIMTPVMRCPHSYDAVGSGLRLLACQSRISLSLTLPSVWCAFVRLYAGRQTRSCLHSLPGSNLYWK